MDAVILTDKSRLQEIYDLRVTAYEQSSLAQHINKALFPNGLKDKLDDSSETYHWIVQDENKIVGSARLALLNEVSLVHDLKEDVEMNLNNFDLPMGRPFAYWSRLVVHPDYRKTNIMQQLDKARKNFLLQNSKIAFAICLIREERKNAIERLGFYFIGNLNYDWDKSITNVFVYLYPR